MKKIYLTILTIASLALTSCEVNLPSFKEQIDMSEAYMSVTALVNANDSIRLRFAYTESYSDLMYEQYDDRNVLWRMLKFNDPIMYDVDTVIMDKYEKELVYGDGEVYFTNNRGERVDMVYNPNTLNYECDYIAQPGETYEFFAKQADSTRPIAVNASAKQKVPDWRPQAEIISCTPVYKERGTYETLPLTEAWMDSVAELKIKITDKSSDLHCYRIKVQGIYYVQTTIFNSPVKYVGWSDAFFSPDPLLYDAAINGQFGPWQPYTTDVFSNASFKDGEYTLTVQTRYPDYWYSRLRNPENGRLIQVVLEPISADLTNYLSSLYRLRVAKQSYFTEPINLPTNVDGAIGIVGAIGRSTTLRYWWPGEEDPNYPAGNN